MSVCSQSSCLAPTRTSCSSKCPAETQCGWTYAVRPVQPWHAKSQGSTINFCWGSWGSSRRSQTPSLLDFYGLVGLSVINALWTFGPRPSNWFCTGKWACPPILWPPLWPVACVKWASMLLGMARCPMSLGLGASMSILRIVLKWN